MDALGFNQLDWVIAAVVGVSSLLGIWRGVVREVVSVAGWITGFIFAFRYASELGEKIPFDAFGEAGKTIAAAILIVIATIVVFSLFGTLLRMIIKAVTGGLGDCILGLLFGFVRGAFIILVCVFIASLTSAPESRLWKSSVLVPYAEAGLEKCRPWMPESLIAVENVAREQQKAAAELLKLKTGV